MTDLKSRKEITISDHSRNHADVSTGSGPRTARSAYQTASSTRNQRQLYDSKPGLHPNIRTMAVPIRTPTARPLLAAPSTQTNCLSAVRAEAKDAERTRVISSNPERA